MHIHPNDAHDLFGRATEYLGALPGPEQSTTRAHRLRDVVGAASAALAAWNHNLTELQALLAEVESEAAANAAPEPT
jgi:hypothetical protein